VVVIVAIDDDRLLHPVIKHTFKGDDFHVHYALDGQQGWELILAHRPDYVLLDLDLPDVAGEEILGRIKADASLEHTKIVLFSGNDLEADAIAKQMPDVIVVHKPFSPAKLLEAITASVEWRSC